MKQLSTFPRIERLPEIPGVPKLTGTGFVLNGKHHRTVPESQPMQQEKKSFWGRLSALRAKQDGGGR